MSQLIRDATQRVGAIPGVAVVSASYNLPVEGNFGIPFNIVGRSPRSGRYDGRGWIGIAPGYFDAFKIPLQRGRAFNERDDAGTAPVAIINQAMVRQFWPTGNPLDDQLILGKEYGPEFEEPARQIIGIVADVHNGPLDSPPLPVVYVPMTQIPDSLTALIGRISPLAWIIRTGVTPGSVSPAIQKELQQASGGLPVASVRSMDEVVSLSTAATDFKMSLMTIFGSSALVLAAIGIYGLMAYSVRQRTQELGIRMALGARASEVRNMILFQGMRMASAGVAIGEVAAFGLTRFIAGLLFGVTTWDPFVFVAIPLLLSGVALLAVTIPAFRATRIDPIQALRCE